MLKHSPFILFFVLLAMPAAGSVIFGRRAYSPQGRTYQQIWTMDERSHGIAQLSNTERRHVMPVCSPDGKRIWFLSGAFRDEANTELWFFDVPSRTEKMAAKFDGRIERLLGGSQGAAFFTGYQSDQPAVYRWDGHLEKLSNVATSVIDAAALSPDARSLAVQTTDAPVVTLMAAGGAQGRMVDGCAGPVWSPDGRKLACVSGTKIRVVDLLTGIEAAHAGFNLRQTPPGVADFAADGRLLVKTVGANHNSTSPQSDYWVVSPAEQKWTFVGPGQSALFAPGGRVLLVTPRELANIGKGRDWLAQMLIVDPATHSQIPAGAGAASNVEPSRCAVFAPPATNRPSKAPPKPGKAGAGKRPVK